MSYVLGTLPAQSLLIPVTTSWQNTFIPVLQLKKEMLRDQEFAPDQMTRSHIQAVRLQRLCSPGLLCPADPVQ